MFLSENLKKYRMCKGLTQEELADYLHITPQSVSKWERGECHPDIMFLPALANIFETSIDLLMGMDTIRAEETRLGIHRKASEYQRAKDYQAAEKVYREALLIYPNKSGMMLGLAGVLALQGKAEEATELIEKGLPLSINEKQKATMRAILCFLYVQCGRTEKAQGLASTLPHTRESREVIAPLIEKGPTDAESSAHIRHILLGE